MAVYPWWVGGEHSIARGDCRVFAFGQNRNNNSQSNALVLLHADDNIFLEVQFGGGGAGGIYRGGGRD